MNQEILAEVIPHVDARDMWMYIERNPGMIQDNEDEDDEEWRLDAVAAQWDQARERWYAVYALLHLDGGYASSDPDDHDPSSSSSSSVSEHIVFGGHGGGLVIDNVYGEQRPDSPADPEDGEGLWWEWAFELEDVAEEWDLQDAEEMWRAEQLGIDDGYHSDTYDR